MNKDLLSSKTFWFNAITILIGVVQVVSNTYPLPTEALALIVGIGNLVLRLLTTEKISSIGGIKLKVDGQ